MCTFRNSTFDPLDYSRPFTLDPARTAALPSATVVEEILDASTIEAISAVGWDTSPGWQVPERSEPHAYLWIVLSGRLRFSIDGHTDEIPAEPGDVVVIPESVRHSVTSPEKGMNRVLVFHYLYRFLGALDVLSLLGVSGRLAVRSVASDMGRELCEAWGARRPGYRSLVEAGLTCLLVPSLARARLVAEPVASSDLRRQLRKLIPAFALVRTRLDDAGLRVGDLAAAAGFSEVYLRRLFSDYLRTTPRRFILEERLRRARDLLLHTDFTVERIAAETGFENLSYFHRVFKARFATSPARFRREPAV